MGQPGAGLAHQELRLDRLAGRRARGEFHHSGKSVPDVAIRFQQAFPQRRLKALGLDPHHLLSVGALLGCFIDHQYRVMQRDVWTEEAIGRGGMAAWRHGGMVRGANPQPVGAGFQGTGGQGDVVIAECL